MIKFLLKTPFKKIGLGLSVVAIHFFSIQTLNAQTLVTTVEAEAGTRAGGLTIGTSNAGYSGSGYVTNMANVGDNLTIPVTVPSAGNYKLVIRYNGLYGTKDQDIYVNGVFASSLNFPATTGYADLTAGSLTLNAGSNTIGIYKNWGYTDFDKITLYTVPLHDYTTVAAAPIDPAATAEAVALYNYFKSSYGQTIISGQTSDKYETVSPNAAKKPVLRAYDFQHYTVGYSYLWNTSTNSQGFGWEDDGTTQAAINWYNSTCQKGIVAFHWHWHSPSGGQPGTNTFYTDYTTFDVTKAVTVGTTEYTAVIRDIDSIATQLKKLQAAGVPVMWRPLHEAGGAWFWWGAKGSAAALKLYDIVYDRLVNYHSIHNLIWQWSTPEPSWYPGNSKVDMLGYDSYPGAYIYGTQKLIFDQLYTIVNGQKMVAMTENGPIPDPDACFTSDAKWAYFMSWSNLVTQQNSAAQLSLVYNHAKVTTLDEVTTATNTAQLTASGPTSFCIGGSVLLKANVAKGYTYKWYNGTNQISGATSSSYTATTAGSYTVAVTATGSCTTTSSPIVVTIGGPTATVTAGGSTTFCQGGSVVLNASTGSGYTYQWNVGGNTIASATNASYTATTTGLYSVKVTVSTCNATSFGTQVTVNTPSVITGPLAVCVGMTTQLTGSGTANATSPWTSSNTMIATVSSTGLVIGQAGGTAIITYKNISGCTSTASVTVNTNPIANITAGSSTTFCQGGSVVLTSTSGTSYKWMLGGNAINGATNAAYTVNSTGIYNVEVTNANNCKAMSTATTVTVSAPPSAPTVTPTISYCQNATATQLTATGTALKWYADNTTTTALASAPTPSTTATGTANYYVSQTTSGCESSRAQISVIVNALPTANITAGGVTTFCQGGSVILTSTTGTSYKWMNGGNVITSATNATYTATSAGSYTVEVTNANNCKKTSTAITVTVNAPPVVPIVTSAVSYCQNATATQLTATGTALKWYADNTTTTALASAPTPSTTATGTINYFVSQTTNGCESSRAQIAVTVNALPTATITSGQNTSCGGVAVLMTASAGTSYKWMLNGTAINGATNATFTATTTGPYTVEVTNASNCKAVSSPVSIPMASAIAITITPSGSASFCQGGSVLLTATTGTAYKWMNGGNVISGATSATYNATTAGSYTVEVTYGPNNCKGTSAPTVVTEATMAATITAGSATTFCQGGNVVLTATTGTTYKWMNGGNVIGGATSATYNAITAGSYTVEVTYGQNCKSTSNPVAVAITSTMTWYADADGDGKGDAVVSTQSCTQPTGYVSTAGDACPNDANKIASGNCGCGATENSCLDCMGVPNGTAALDVCNVCAGGTSDITPKTNISQCTATSTTSALATNMKMYPNPTADNCKIELSGSEFKVSIYTSSGILLSSSEFQNEAIIGAGLSQGIYLIRIEQDGKTELRKLIKQ